MNKHLLLIDDELEIRELAVDFFSGAGYHIDLAMSGNEGIAMMGKQDYDVVIT
ncbi:MAG: DNA-binding response regulator, partial [Xanthomonadaceae bacterium]|nr:DNA-binding response regulator [Xanthomonadaceae bacterium]